MRRVVAYERPMLSPIVAKTEASITSSVWDWRIRRISDRVSHCQGHIQLQLCQLSEELGVTPSHASRCFKQQLGIGFRAFATRRRDDLVCELLARTSFQIKQIADLAGYRHASDLCCRFHEMHGISPSAYRQGLRNMPTGNPLFHKE
jgi:AraC-like DNA-binding protein